MNVFLEDDYRSILKNCLLEKKNSIGRAFTFQKMADACRIHKTYLSTVLNGNGHLSSDQTYQAGHFLQLDEDQSEFVLLLNNYQRSVSEQRKVKLLKKINMIKKSRSQSHEYLKPIKKNKSDEIWREYYLNPLNQIVHIFLTIERFRQDPPKIARHLGVSQLELEKVLATLVKLEIIERKDHGINVVVHDIHLPPEDIAFEAQNRLLRLKALERSKRPDDYSFSAIFSSSDSVVAEMRQEFLDLLATFKNKVNKGAKEQVYQLNFDCFRW